MLKTKLTSIAVFACAVVISTMTQAQAQSAAPVKVTPETFIRAETDARFAGTIKRAGGVNRPSYFRVPTPLDAQIVMRKIGRAHV